MVLIRSRWEITPTGFIINVGEEGRFRNNFVIHAARTIETLVKVSAWSALYRMYLHAQLDRYGFQFVGLPDDYESNTATAATAFAPL